MRERDFQKNLIKEIKTRLPGCIVMKNDSSYIQGIPDLTVLYGNRWAFLEVKKSKSASHRPNQDIYIDKANNEMKSYGAFIYPKNKGDILDEMERALQTSR